MIFFSAVSHTTVCFLANPTERCRAKIRDLLSLCRRVLNFSLLSQDRLRSYRTTAPGILHRRAVSASRASVKDILTETMSIRSTPHVCNEYMKRDNHAETRVSNPMSYAKHRGGLDTPVAKIFSRSIFMT
jgi:hypothetical protein